MPISFSCFSCKPSFVWCADWTDRPTAYWPAIRHSSLVKCLAFCLFSAPVTPHPSPPYFSASDFTAAPASSLDRSTPAHTYREPGGARGHPENRVLWPSTRARPGCPLHVLIQKMGKARGRDCFSIAPYLQPLAHGLAFPPLHVTQDLARCQVKPVRSWTAP